MPADAENEKVCAAAPTLSLIWINVGPTSDAFVR